RLPVGPRRGAAAGRARDVPERARLHDLAGRLLQGGAVGGEVRPDVVQPEQVDLGLVGPERRAQPAPLPLVDSGRARLPPSIARAAVVAVFRVPPGRCVSLSTVAPVPAT